MQMKDIWYEWYAPIFNSCSGVWLWRVDFPIYLANSGPGQDNFKDYPG